LDIDKIVNYLRNEGLIESRRKIGDYNISHRGVREIEDALSKPEQATNYFPPAIHIINVGQMVDSQIQQASPGAIMVGSINEEQSERLIEILQNLNNVIEHLNLESPQVLELQAEIQTIKAQTTSPMPKRGIINEGLGSIRRILENASGRMIASEFKTKIIPIIATIGSFLADLV